MAVEVKVVDVSPDGLSGYISAFVLIGEKVAVVDPGPESSYNRLLEGLRSLGVTPDLVVATHVHLDHSGSAAHLMKDFQNVVTYAHPRGVPHIIDPTKLYQASFQVAPILPQTYGKPLPGDPSRVRPIGDGETISLGDGYLKVIHTPGHASHHMSLLLEPNKIIFTGDSAGVIFTVAGREVMIPTTPPPFKPKMYRDSINKMKSYSPKLIAPTHFGLHDNAMVWLDRAEQQVVEWIKALNKAASNGAFTYDEALLALSGDPDVLWLKAKGEEFMIKGFLENTIDGLVDAIRRGEPLN